MTLGTFQDRRQYQRIKVKIPVRLISEEVEYSGELVNLSLGGALAEISGDLEDFALVHLEIPEIATFKTIVLKSGSPCSFQFHNISAEGKEKIQNFLERYELSTLDA